jgi:hypothetical protein
VARTPPNAELDTINATIRPHQGSPSSRTGYVPVNAAGQRVDSYLRLPTNDGHNKYKSRTKGKKLCTSLHLTGSCYQKKCRFDHSAITPTILHVLRHKLRECPCTHEGECRQADCFYGHVCFAKGCAGHWQSGCRFKLEAHGVDLLVVKWVRPGGAKTVEAGGVYTDVPAQQDGKAKKEAAKDNSWFEMASSKGSMENWPTMVGDLIEV